MRAALDYLPKNLSSVVFGSTCTCREVLEMFMCQSFDDLKPSADEKEASDDDEKEAPDDEKKPSDDEKEIVRPETTDVQNPLSDEDLETLRRFVKKISGFNIDYSNAAQMFFNGYLKHRQGQSQTFKEYLETEPFKIVYHGSPCETLGTTGFDVSRRKRTKHVDGKLGEWFADDDLYASEYGYFVHAVLVNMRYAVNVSWHKLVFVGGDLKSITCAAQDKNAVKTFMIPVNDETSSVCLPVGLKEI